MRHQAAVPPSARDLGQKFWRGDHRDPASRRGWAASSLRRSHGMMPGGRWAGRGAAQQKHRGLKPRGHTRQSLELRPRPLVCEPHGSPTLGSSHCPWSTSGCKPGAGHCGRKALPTRSWQARPGGSRLNEGGKACEDHCTGLGWGCGCFQEKLWMASDGARNAIRLGESGGVGGWSPRSCEPGRKPWAGRQASGQKSSCPRSPLLGICHRK